MTQDQGDQKLDQSPDIIVVRPPIESLLHIKVGDSFWPEKVRDHELIRKQAETRQRLYAKLELLFQNAPKADVEMPQALASLKVEQTLLTEIYELLAEFLENDPYHKRLVLYLPFELLPNRAWQPKSHQLKASLDRFINVYMSCWRALLAGNDVRANFVDGNILEPELSPNGQPLARKAAHLIPQLVQKGYISKTEVVALLDETSDEILKQSVVDTLPVLVSLGLFQRDEADRLLRASGTLPLATKAILRPQNVKERSWFTRFAGEAAYELKKNEMRQALDLSRGLPKPRVAWERQDREEKLIAKYADDITALLAANQLNKKDIQQFLLSGRDQVPRLAIIHGIGKAIEVIAKTDLRRAQEVFCAYETIIVNLWLENIPDMKDALTSVLLRLRSLDIVDDAYLQLFSLTLPQFDAPFTSNGQAVRMIKKFTPAIQSIVSDSEISRLIYPVAIFYGSFLKGYAKSKADLDVAVFVRDGVSIDERRNVQKVLTRLFSDKKINGKVVEFWLTENSGELSVRSFSDADVLLADHTWAHLLLASAWLGTKDAIQELYEKLLPGFIYSGGKTVDGRDLRRIWLEEIEREVLQYRLMHKGYKRFYAEQGGVVGERSEALDPESSFWDSGYRRVATKLFITRVFLPHSV